MGSVSRHVDHLVIPVLDLDAAAAELVRSGFVVTPRADHPFGTSNRLVVFAYTYLELVAVTRPELIPAAGFAADVAEFIGAGPGVSHVVVSSADPDADRDLLLSRGAEVGDVFEFSRPAPRADGSMVTASFRIVPTPAPGPLGSFLCAHEVPEAVWHPSHLVHPNGAGRILGIRLPAPAPPLFAVLEVSGVEFGLGAPRLTTDGHHDPATIGNLTLASSAGVS